MIQWCGVTVKLVVVSSRDDLFAGRPQEDGVLELSGHGSGLRVDKRGVVRHEPLLDKRVELESVPGSVRRLILTAKR